MDESLALPGTANRLMLMPSDDGYCPAMVAQRPDGEEMWSARPPSGEDDAWVSVRIEDNTVLANSFSGWMVRLDAASGHEIERKFTK